MTKKFKRVACVCLTGVMAASLAAGNVLALADDRNAAATASAKIDTVSFEDVTGKVDISSVVLQNLSASVLENAGYTTKNETRTVIVTLDKESVIESMPEGATASDYLTSYAGRRTLKNIQQEQTDFLNSLSSLGVDYNVVYQYTTVTNAIAIEVNTAYLSTIKSIASVQTACVSETYAAPEAVETTSVNAVSNPSNVYATGIYDSSAYVGQGYDGSGMTVAILDTGLDYTHEAFSVMPETVGFTKDDITEKLSANTFNSVALSAKNGKNISADDLYINAKVPYAYDYADKDAEVYPSYSQHGTHVAGIVAGQADSYTDKDGNIATDSDGNILSFRGVAPEAQLVICKVFTDDLESDDIGGATSEDILAALEDCVLLGVDIINMSLGTTGGFSSLWIDGDDEGQALYKVYNDIKKTGISLICAASNDYSAGFGSAFGTNLASNPDSGTIGSPSTFDGAVSVASVNGQLSPFMVANAGTERETAVFYTESSDANSVKYNFVSQILEGELRQTFKYVVIPGIGQAADYTTSIQNTLKDKSEGKVIAVIKRGTSTFEDKVEIAQRMGADAVIIYNNVAGTVGMSLGDLEDPIPAVSITLDAGKALCYNADGSLTSTGYITVDSAYLAGPFMNDYSSWGTTPDLKLKPDITSHGGEITSTVAGGYAEMSGTSMASPNMAGFVAILKGYLKQQFPEIANNPTELTRLTNQILMSTATTVYDQEGLPYSPRKQGAGLGTLDNVFGTKAYLYTIEGVDFGAEDNRPKIELGEDEDKNGVYTFSFYVKNFGSTALTFTPNAIFMTETLASDGLAVAEKAHLLTDVPAVFKINGAALDQGADFTVASGESAKIQVTLTLSDAEKSYIDTNFVNGMFVEGFIKLLSENGDQCDLTLPFLGFYGDWEAAPMLDYSSYEISAFEQDTSLDDENRPQASVWATQAYSTYYNEKYSVPMGSFLYLQDESADQIYIDEEHAAISHYNWYHGEDSLENYMTTTSIKALYAGLLRNAELVTYDLYDAETGEILKQGCDYRVSKAYASGGSAVPAQVLLELYPDDLGLVNNGKYQMIFHFYFKAEDANDPAKQNDDNTFSMIFYVDYEAPILVDSRIRYYDYKDGTQEKQKVYLDLDIYDNNYAQAVILCYAEDNTGEDVELKMATEYVTPIYNATKNGLTTVSIEVTDIYEKYQNRMYVQIDDYALNHSIYMINFKSSSQSTLPDSFEISGNTEVTLGVNETFKVALTYDGSANLSNFTWTSNRPYVAKVYNGEIFGVAPGTATITVTGANGVSKKLTVTVVESGKTLTWPSLSFGVIENATGSAVKASGVVSVNAGEQFRLEISADPWYYPLENLTLVWSSSDETVATVDQNGNVQTLDKKGTAIIEATIMNGSIQTAYSATVALSVQDPFTVSSTSLTDYHGTGTTEGQEKGVVVIPDDKNIMTIGEEAFKDNDNIRVIIIPKTVTTISERAFINCSALEEVYFIQDTPMAIADADLSMIMKHAFYNCTALKKVDLSNTKIITVDKEVFVGCTALEEVVKMSNIGTMNDRAFYGCTSLLSADLTGLHMSGASVFAGCTSLKEITTDFYTAIGESMFSGCTSLTNVTINTAKVAANAFEYCTALREITFGSESVANRGLSFNIGSQAFYNCIALTTVNFNGYPVSAIGDMAFANCSSLKGILLPAGETQFGDRVFANTPVSIGFANGTNYVTDQYGAVYSGTKLVLAPKEIDESFAIRTGTTEIGSYAFSGCTFNGATTIVIPETVTVIGEGAFAYSEIQSIVIPSKVTQIAAYAFQGTPLSEIVIPSQIVSIGDSAFDSCANLKTVSFAANSSLKEIGSFAFAGCSSLTEIELPDGASVMGDNTFNGCTSLVRVTLPSVTVLGAYTFFDCPVLTTVVYGADATVSGAYTFHPGGHYTSENGGFVYHPHVSALANVTLSDKMLKLGDGVFESCTALENVDLKNITVIGSSAFYGCVNLTTVTGLENVTEIGNYAFAGCSALTTLRLDSAKTIGEAAFYMENGSGSYSSLYLPVAETVGSFAFYGGGETTVTIPASLRTLGAAAFANSPNLEKFVVDEANPIFFAEDGVLYRLLSNALTGQNATFELCAYPSAKVAEAAEDGVKTYEILAGTVTVQAYAFSRINAGTIEKIIVPYSVKTLGHAAFFAGGIGEYRFESINAPVLLTDYHTISETEYAMTYYTLLYMTFEKELLAYTSFANTPEESTLKMSYPSNGVGYDNYVYTHYFGSSVELEEMMDDTTRGLKEMIEGFVSADEVKGWLSLSVTAENKAMVEAFSEQVKEAHRIYNNMAGEQVQLGYLGAENIQKLTDIEAELKAVKALFGITVKVTSLTLSGTPKTDYKAGEVFDQTGFSVLVTYDDYSTELIDSTALTLLTTAPLTDTDNVVSLTYGGATLRILISVASENTPGVDPDSGNGDGTETKKSGCSCAAEALAGVAVLAVVAVAALLVIRKRRAAASANAGTDTESDNADFGKDDRS